MVASFVKTNVQKSAVGHCFLKSDGNARMRANESRVTGDIVPLTSQDSIARREERDREKTLYNIGGKGGWQKARLSQWRNGASDKVLEKVFLLGPNQPAHLWNM